MSDWSRGIGLLVLALVSCNSRSEDTLFQQIPAQTSGITFMNTVENSKEMNIFNYRNFYNGGGVAIGDINNDGLPDIYFTNNTGANKLYLNKGEFRFEDITVQAGVGGSRTWSTGVVLADVDADGYLDIYVCNAGYIQGEDQENELFLNNGDLTFTESAETYGLNQAGYTTHAAFFDYDLDGDLDVYVLNNSFVPAHTLNYENKRDLKAEDWPVRDFLKGGGDKLLRNDSGLFHDVTEEAGIFSSLIGFGLGVTVGDVNGDRFPDLYISNDFFERDYLYINKGDGTFKEDIKNWVSHLSLFSMGADMSDINNDGYPEIFVTDMLPDSDVRLKTTASFDTYSVFDLKLKRDFYYQFMHNTLHLNNTDSTFSEISFYSGVAASDWSWGALMFDMDNDGYRDIYVCNGISQDVTDQDFIDFFANEIIQKMALTAEKEDMEKILKNMPSARIANKSFRNRGNLEFEDMAGKWGLDAKTFSNGAAYADLDLDGDLDLVVNNLQDTALVYRNNSSESGRHWISLQLQGDANNRFALGALVKLYRPRDVLTTEVIPSRGFQSSVDYKIVYGLGESSAVDSLEVTWPDLSIERFYALSADTTYTIQKATGSHVIRKPDITDQSKLLTRVEVELGQHVEDDYVDFYYEGLLPRKLSREGPAVLTRDLNGDGFEDIYTGGARGQAGRIYLGTTDGFILTDQPGLQMNADFEDTAAELADVDGDGDLDLYAGSGGNHVIPNSRELHDRLYLNDGKGVFTLDASALPQNGMNTSTVLSVDVDDDGDLDFVVASRSIPFNYGSDPRNFVFLNDGAGKFTDVTSEIAAQFYRSGLITDALSADILGNGREELIVVGEWMAPRVFSLDNGGMRPLATDLDGLAGWWESIAAEDLDNDGDIDLVLGNIGQNFYLKPSDEQPIKLWISDFDDNGTAENVITRTIDGRDVPVPLKAELTEQVVSLKKESLKHADYATKSIQELFSRHQIETSLVKRATEFRSLIAWNNGKGSFSIDYLPVPVQFSCVRGILCEDVNGDGIKDIIMAGNDFGFTPQFSKLDGAFGHIVLVTPEGELEYLPGARSGLRVRGEMRSIERLEHNGQRYVILGMNNDRTQLYRIEGRNGNGDNALQ